jgi:hypothetical protein
MVSLIICWVLQWNSVSTHVSPLLRVPQLMVWAKVISPATISG